MSMWLCVSIGSKDTYNLGALIHLYFCKSTIVMELYTALN